MHVSQLWSELGMITDVRHFDSAAVNQVDQALPRLNCLWFAINDGCHVLSVLRD
jgi:hypothetical protein